MAVDIREGRSSIRDQFTPLEILRRGIREKVPWEVLNVADIIIEDSIIDESHALQLGESMQEPMGQIQNIGARAREMGCRDDAIVVYDPTDGFHRVAGKKLTGEPYINSTVLYNITDEELFDYRILAVNSVANIQWPRLGEWLLKCYMASEWASCGLTLAQVFAMIVNDSSRSNIVDLSPEQVKGVKNWGVKKCVKWHAKADYVYGVVNVTSKIDPDIVREVRLANGGDDSEEDQRSRVTPSRLTIVASQFGGEEYFGVQRAVLDYMIQHELPANRAKLLLIETAYRVKPGMKRDMAFDLIKDIDPQKLVLPKTESLANRLRRSVEDLTASIDESKRRFRIWLRTGREEYLSSDQENLIVEGIFSGDVPAPIISDKEASGEKSGWWDEVDPKAGEIIQRIVAGSGGFRKIGEEIGISEPIDVVQRLENALTMYQSKKAGNDGGNSV